MTALPHRQLALALVLELELEVDAALDLEEVCVPV